MARPSSPRTTQPLCIALVAVAPRGSSSGRRPDLADTPFTLPGSPSLSLPPDRTPPSPPFAIATVSDHPSLPRVAQKLRHNSLFLPTLHETPEALHRRHVAVPLFGLRPPSPTNSLSPARPRARFDAHCNRGELRHRFPLFSPSFPHRSLLPTTAEPPPSPSSPSTQLR